MEKIQLQRIVHNNTSISRMFTVSLEVQHVISDVFCLFVCFCFFLSEKSNNLLAMVVSAMRNGVQSI